jgi:alkylation response protein AidB-like acyl-CoA dehydrogenase
MDFSLNEEQRGWQMKARRFAEEEIRPVSLERERIAEPLKTWDWDIIKKGSKLGFRTAVVAKKWGGHGIDFVTQALVMAELAKADSAISKSFSQCWKFSHLIAAACNDEQKERFLKAFVADDTYVMGSAGTEPNAGSDCRLPPEDDPRAGHRLRAERHGDEWILNGEKTFIANGSVGKLFFVNTRTNPDVSITEGTTVFMVPSSTPGFRVGKVFNKAGWRFYQNAELIFENARVPHANVVGGVNAGLKARTGPASAFSDFELACNALGVCDDACESATRWAQGDEAVGRPLIGQQIVQLKLAEMHMLTEALRAFVMHAAWEMDQKRYSAPNIVLVMNFATDVIQRVTALNLGIHATAGHEMSTFADKLVRDSMIWSHLAGDTTQRLKAVKRLLK